MGSQEMMITLCGRVTNLSAANRLIDAPTPIGMLRYHFRTEVAIEGDGFQLRRVVLWGEDAEPGVRVHERLCFTVGSGVFVLADHGVMDLSAASVTFLPAGPETGSPSRGLLRVPGSRRVQISHSAP